MGGGFGGRVCGDGRDVYEEIAVGEEGNMGFMSGLKDGEVRVPGCDIDERRVLEGVIVGVSAVGGLESDNGA